MKFCTLVSGSSGNCVYVNEGDRHLLVDIGLSLRALTAQLAELGLKPHELSGLLLTHEHGDHTKGLYQFALRTGVPIYGARETLMGILARKEGILPDRLTAFSSEGLGQTPGGNSGGRIGQAPGESHGGRSYEIGGFSVRPFEVPHDVPCLGYRIEGQSGALGIATDMGHLAPSVLEGLSGVDFALIEANHDVDMLRFGGYPAVLKRRILSDRGHLCNQDCGELACLLMDSGCRHFLLGHLSHNNNLPSLAVEAVCGALAARGARPGQITVDVAPRFEPSALFEFQGSAAPAEVAV